MRLLDHSHEAGNILQMDTPCRISEGDSRQDALTKLAECNPGATMAMLGLMQHAEERGTDPLRPLLQLDAAGVYGASIWMLHKDVCGQVPQKVSCVLDAWQNGGISGEVLHHAIQNRGAGIPPWVLDGSGGTAGLAKGEMGRREAVSYPEITLRGR